MPRVYVSIGSNEDRERNVRTALAALRDAFGDVTVSSVYEADAVGFDGEPFLNLAAGFDTDLDLHRLVATLHGIEARCGRRRTGKRFGPRPMDIDVLTYGDATGLRDPVEVPRGEMLEQAYVLHPLAEIAPDARHPALGERYAALAARLRLDDSGIHRLPEEPTAASPAMPGRGARKGSAA